MAFAGDWNLRSAVVTGKANRLIRYLERGVELVARDIRHRQKTGHNVSLKAFLIKKMHVLYIIVPYLQVTQGILIIELGQFSVVTHACVNCKDIIQFN